MNFAPLMDSFKKYGAFAILFCTLFVWTITNYEKREALYMQHEAEYHKIITDNQVIISKAQSQMQEQQKTLEGFRVILDIRLSNIESNINNLKK